MSAPKAYPNGKRCGRCREVKTVEEYPKARQRGIYLQAYCRACTYSSQRPWVARRRAAGDVRLLYPGGKHCPSCRETKPAEAFVANKLIRAYLPAYCRKCHLEKYQRTKAEHKAYADKHRERFRLKSREGQRRLRLQVLRHYSGGTPRCACCGETRYQFLALDHINGRSESERSARRVASAKLCTWLRRHDFPPGFQVLCHNCNCAKGFYGQCPHVAEKRADANAFEQWREDCDWRAV